MRCHWTTVDGERHFIPGCWGAVNGSERDCYCPPRNSSADVLDRVAGIRSEATSLAKQIKELIRVCDRFEAMQIKLATKEQSHV